MIEQPRRSVDQAGPSLGAAIWRSSICLCEVRAVVEGSEWRFRQGIGGVTRQFPYIR